MAQAGLAFASTRHTDQHLEIDRAPFIADYRASLPMLR
jgi:hypothetical protein